MKARLRLYLINYMWKGVAKRVAHEQPYVVAVTGTVGKTSCKEAMALVLRQSDRAVVKPAGSLNTEVGVPLALLGYSSTPQGLLGWFSVLLRSFNPPKLAKNSHPYYVLEFSADKPGDILFLATKMNLQVGVLTAITPAHLQEYKNFEELVAEKASIFKGLDQKGYAVLNADDPQQQKIALLVVYGL